MANIFIFGYFLAIIRFLMFGGRCNRDIIMKTKLLLQKSRYIELYRLFCNNNFVLCFS